jgi:hypothetical protein
MKKIIKLIILLFIGATLFTGCSNISQVSIGQDNSIKDYILLNSDIPEGFILTPMSDDKNSPTSDLISNPGGFDPNYTFGSSNQFNQKEIYEKEMNLNENEYIFVSYTHKETGKNQVLTLIDFSVASKFENVGHTGSTKVLITKEGYLIWVQSSSVSDIIIDTYLSSFEGIKLKEFKQENNQDPSFNLNSQNIQGILDKSSVDENKLIFGIKYFSISKSDLSLIDMDNILINSIICTPTEIVNLKSDSNGDSISFSMGDEGSLIYSCDSPISEIEVISGEIKLKVSNSEVSGTFVLKNN